MSLKTTVENIALELVEMVSLAGRTCNPSTWELRQYAVGGSEAQV